MKRLVIFSLFFILLAGAGFSNANAQVFAQPSVCVDSPQVYFGARYPSYTSLGYGYGYGSFGKGWWHHRRRPGRCYW